MKHTFQNLDTAKFKSLFPDDDSCLKYLANLKWSGGFVCRKCGHANYCKGKTKYARRCTRCKQEESVTAHTIFHRCIIPLKEAFEIAFQVCNSPDISTYELAKKMARRQMTCWKFKKRVMDCIESKGALTLYHPSDSDLS
jgi:hypothetical protein